MYESYWQLNSRPFSYRVASEDLFRSASLQAAALRMRYCIDNNAGAALLVGGSGVGKSSLLRQLHFEDPALHPFAHVVFPTLSTTELCSVVADEVAATSSAQPESQDAVLKRISRSLLAAAESGHRGLIAFDEAHLLTNDALNQVVLPLLNLSDTDSRLSCTVILCGQPLLASHVARNAQLRERIAVTAVLEPFTDGETAEYITSRLKLAGAEQPIFTDDALRAVYTLSGGNPRRINRLCDMALLVGCADKLTVIGAREVESLSGELLPAAA
ncbi:MAG: AAA family ATPase [Planctomycetaceae bacterium]|nr:AAA family ATPase [Planctomycetaceae bacterium]